MRTKTDMSVEQRRRVTLGVLQRIHVALASIESHRLNGDSHDGWPSRQAMDVDYTVLEEMKKLVCNGENLATTQHSRLFVMRELVLANANCILPDSDYILSEKGAWFSCGAVSIRLREARDGHSVICAMYPLGRENDDELAQCEVSYADAREASEAVPA